MLAYSLDTGWCGSFVAARSATPLWHVVTVAFEYPQAGAGCGVALPTVYRRRPMPPSESRHTADFKLSITKALADQLAERLAPLCRFR